MGEEKRGRGAGKPPPRFQSEMLARGMTAMMALLAAMALAPMVAGQVLTPDEYRTCNVPPSSNDTVDVYTSALLERLIDVNDRAYEFTAILFLYFSWEDPTAMDKMITSTNAYRNGSGDSSFLASPAQCPPERRKGTPLSFPAAMTSGCRR